MYTVTRYFVFPGRRVLHGAGSTTREALSGKVGITNETSASFQHAGYQRHEASFPCSASLQALYTDVTSSHTDEGENVLATEENTKPRPQYFPIFFFNGSTAPWGPRPPHYRCFTITLRYIILGRTPLDEWSARRRDLCLTTHNNHKRETSMPPAGFETAIPASEGPRTHGLDRAAIGIILLSSAPNYMA